MEVGVAESALLVLLAEPAIRDPIAVAGGDVPIETIGGDVDLPADEPLRPRRIPAQDLVPSANPIELLCGEPGPKPLQIAFPLAVGRIARHYRVLAEIRRRRKGSLLVQHRLDRLAVSHDVGPPSRLRRALARVGH